MESYWRRQPRGWGLQKRVWPHWRRPLLEEDQPWGRSQCQLHQPWGWDLCKGEEPSSEGWVCFQGVGPASKGAEPHHPQGRGQTWALTPPKKTGRREPETAFEMRRCFQKCLISETPQICLSTQKKYPLLPSKKDTSPNFQFPSSKSAHGAGAAGNKGWGRGRHPGDPDTPPRSWGGGGGGPRPAGENMPKSLILGLMVEKWVKNAGLGEKPSLWRLKICIYGRLNTAGLSELKLQFSVKNAGLRQKRSIF